jgi:hypothetical protein
MNKQQSVLARANEEQAAIGAAKANEEQTAIGASKG